MEGVGSPPRAAQVSKTAPRGSGPEATTKITGDAAREAKATPSQDLSAPSQDLAAAPPPDANARGGVSPPTPGHGLGQRVDIKV
ncbi:MAG: hypothetical protein IID55_08915 [Proteobacteria bacterium]|nr:hypothetical protein [Pseudomonadota bacterium]